MEMKLNIDQIRKGKKSFQWETTIKDLDLETLNYFDEDDMKKNFHKEFIVYCDTSMVGTEIFANFHFDVHLNLKCFRCLEDVAYPLHVESVKVIKLTRKNMKNDDGDPDFLVIDDSVQEVDLFNDVRDLFFLSLPRKTLCEEECKGLCPVCGTNLNKNKCKCEKRTDPRLSVLKNFLQQ